MEANIVLVENPTRAMWRAIAEPLARYHEEQVGQRADHQLVVMTLAADHSDEISGGLWATTAYANLHIELLFVPAELRSHGLGTRLLELAEQEAARRGCRAAWVETYSFGATAFYEHRGYTRFGELPDHPVGHSRIFLRKSLTDFAAAADAM
jgi:GNAT superfamily N-acetyltransferase